MWQATTLAVPSGFPVRLCRSRYEKNANKRSDTRAIRVLREKTLSRERTSNPTRGLRRAPTPERSDSAIDRDHAFPLDEQCRLFYLCSIPFQHRFGGVFGCNLKLTGTGCQRLAGDAATGVLGHARLDVKEISGPGVIARAGHWSA
jgi:hypothetical protein